MEAIARIDDIGTLEGYLMKNQYDFSSDPVKPMKINSNLYRYMSNLQSTLKQQMINSNKSAGFAGSAVRFNSCVFNVGLHTFNDRVNEDSLDKLLLKSGEYADGCVLGLFDAHHSANGLTKPGHCFAEAYLKNWSQTGGTLTTNYYATDWLNNVLAKLKPFGFSGRSGTKNCREFILLLGLSRSEILQGHSKAYKNVLKISEDTLKSIEELL